MFTNKVGKIIVAVGVLCEGILGAVSYFGLVGNAWIWMLGVALITAILYMVATTGKDMLCVAIYAVCLCLVLIGAGRLTMSMTSTAVYMHVTLHNYQAVTNIERGSALNEPTHIRLFEYDGYQYYTDTGYTFLYQIKRNGLQTEVHANTIALEKDFINAFGTSTTEYYAMDEALGIEDQSQDRIAIAFPLEVSDPCVFIKIVSPENKVFYTYLDIGDKARLLEDLGIVSESISIGSASILVTGTTVIQDGTGNSEDQEEGERYMLSSDGDLLFASHLAIAKYEEKDLGYADRVNWFMYHKVNEFLDEYKAELASMPEGTDEAKALAEIIANTEASIVPYKIELIEERFFEENAVRIYRARDVSGSYATGKDLGVIELLVDGVYLYGFAAIDFFER